MRRARLLGMIEFSTLPDQQGCRARLMSVSLGTSPCSSTDAVRKVSADGLLLALAKVPDPRDPRGVRYRLATLLAIGVCAMTAAGHNSLGAIAEWARRCDQEALARLGCPFDPFASRYRAPGEWSSRGTPSPKWILARRAPRVSPGSPRWRRPPPDR
ncbi:MULTISPECIES: transposase family protein [unclassified Streptomyces]|uniref:transposase family protein n=2 Tax=unclassified Streptomyces TaxID=2593676 RepID=UPI002E1D33ED